MEGGYFQDLHSNRRKIRSNPDLAQIPLHNPYQLLLVEDEFGQLPRPSPTFATVHGTTFIALPPSNIVNFSNPPLIPSDTGLLKTASGTPLCERLAIVCDDGREGSDKRLGAIRSNIKWIRVSCDGVNLILFRESSIQIRSFSLRFC